MIGEVTGSAAKAFVISPFSLSVFILFFLFVLEIVLGFELPL